MFACKPHIAKLIAVLGFAFMLQSCAPDSPGIWKNNSIKSGKREQFHGFNDKLFIAAKENKLYDAESLMSAELLETPGYKRTVELIGNMSKGGYTMLDEYYIINNTPKDKYDTLTKAIDGTPYRIAFQAGTEEMYVAFTTLKDGENKWLLTSVYCKLDYGWKLRNLSIDKFTIGGKNTEQLYLWAKQQYAKGYLIDALSNLQSALEIAGPGPLWSYPDEKEMSKLNKELVAQFYKQYKFPMVMEQVGTHPQIFRVMNEDRGQGSLPAVYYLSKIKVSDTTALQQENNVMMKQIGSFMPGIDKDKKYLYFSVFNEKPGEKKAVPSFDILVKL